MPKLGTRRARGSSWAARATAAAVATVSALATLAATVLPGTPVAAQEPRLRPPASVTFVHGILGVAVDLYLEGTLAVPGFQPRAIAGPVSLAAGTYRVQLYPAAAAPPASAPGQGALLDQQVALTERTDVTIVVHPTFRLGGPGVATLSAFVNDRSSPGPTSGRLSIRHTAHAPAVDVLVDGTPAGTALANAGRLDLAPAAGPLTVALRPTGSAVTALGPLGLTVTPGVLTNLYAISALDGSGLTVVAQNLTLGLPPAVPTASVAVVHAILGVEVDVYVDGRLTLGGFAPRSVAGPLELSPGRVRVQMFARVPDPPMAAPAAGAVIDQTLDVPASANLSLVAHLDAAGTPRVTVFANDTGPLAAGATRISVRHAAAAGAVDVLAGGTRLVAGLANGAAATIDVPALAGAPVTAVAAGTATAVPGLSSTSFSSPAGVLTAVYAASSLAAPRTFEFVVQTVRLDAGYRIAAADGAVRAFGNAPAVAATARPGSVVHAAATPTGAGWWTVTADGVVQAYGDAAAGIGPGEPIRPLAAPIIRVVPTPSGRGLWLLGRDGGVFSYGDARFFGSTGALRLNAPVVGMAATPSGQGYWLVAADGGIFSYGDARFHGSTGSLRLNQPIVAMAVAPAGRGYWLVASDGGVFAFGNADFLGSTGNLTLVSPVVDVKAAPHGRGYWLLAADGGVFSFGTAFAGSAAGSGTRAVALL